MGLPFLGLGQHRSLRSPSVVVVVGRKRGSIGAATRENGDSEDSWFDPRLQTPARYDATQVAERHDGSIPVEACCQSNAACEATGFGKELGNVCFLSFIRMFKLQELSA